MGVSTKFDLSIQVISSIVGCKYGLSLEQDFHLFVLAGFCPPTHPIMTFPVLLWEMSSPSQLITNKYQDLDFKV